MIFLILPIRRPRRATGRKSLNAGRFEVHTGTSGSRYTFSQARFTAKGVKWVADLWAAYSATPQTKGAAA
ncbi:hypothetical protein SGGMMB4_01432 [Sodalis glossinidius str. 'morsitans']|uniref:Phage antirepressor protein KilAC domain protein n=1 Tax=Sodalis glossinidius (strain morsitans) TaxID=343509 RepID=A0A193QGQ2_SODGM|nr:hypothetical protein SGGMMB4_01432 [Sodalis glossinidius str. 'morsitans']